MIRNRSALLAGGLLLVCQLALPATLPLEPVIPFYRLVDTAAQRLATADPVAASKWINGGPITDPQRADQVLDAVGSRRVRPVARCRGTCGRSSPTRSRQPRESSTRASVSGSSIRPPPRPPPPTCPNRARRSTDSTRRWSRRLRCTGIHCTARVAGGSVGCDGGGGQRPPPRRAVPQALSSATRSYCGTT